MKLFPLMGGRVRTFLAALLISLALSPSAGVGLASPNPARISLYVRPRNVRPGRAVSIRASAWSADGSLLVELTVFVQGPGFTRTLGSAGGSGRASWSGSWRPPARGRYEVWAIARVRRPGGGLRGSATAHASIRVAEPSAWRRAPRAAGRPRPRPRLHMRLRRDLAAGVRRAVSRARRLAGRAFGLLRRVGTGVSHRLAGIRYRLDRLSYRASSAVRRASSGLVRRYWGAVHAVSGAADRSSSPAAVFALSAAEAIVEAPGGTALGFAVGAGRWYRLTSRANGALSRIDRRLERWARRRLPRPAARLVSWAARLDSSARSRAAFGLAGLMEAANFLSFGLLGAVRDAAARGKRVGYRRALREELRAQTLPGQVAWLLEESLGPRRSWRERARAAGTLAGLAILAASTSRRRASGLESNPRARALLRRIRLRLGGRRAGIIKKRAIEVAELFGEEEAIRYLRGDANFVRLLGKERIIRGEKRVRIYLKLSSYEIGRLGLKSEEYANLVFRTADGRTFEVSLKVPKEMSNGKMEIVIPYLSDMHPELANQLVELEVRPPRDVGWLMSITDDRGYRKLKVSSEYTKMKGALREGLAPDRLVRVEVDGRGYYAVLRRSGDDLTLTLPRDVPPGRHLVRIREARLGEVFPSEPVPGLRLEYSGETMSVSAVGDGGRPLTIAEGIRPELDPYTGELRLLFSVNGVEFALGVDGGLMVRVCRKWVGVERVRVVGGEVSVVTGLGEVSLGGRMRAGLSTVKEDLTLNSPIVVPDEILKSPEIQAGISEYVNSLRGGEEGTFRVELGDLGEDIAKRYFRLKGFEFEDHGRRSSMIDGFVIENGVKIPVEVKTSAVDDFSTLISRAIRGDVRSSGEVRGGALNKYFRSHPEVPYGYAVAVKYEDGRLLMLIRKVVNPFSRTAGSGPPTRPPDRTRLPESIPG